MDRATNKNEKRAKIAEETLGILHDGRYQNPAGESVRFGIELEEAKNDTKLYDAADSLGPQPQPRFLKTTVSVTNETTGAAIRRLYKKGEHLACLNFASAKTPGGGFLRGATAQEEDLALSSGLHACLLQMPEFYDRNRAMGSAMYLDLAIYSPLVPFFRDDQMGLTPEIQLASVITCPAPNTGVIQEKEPEALLMVSRKLSVRIQMILEIAKHHQVDRLILGAWGCGVFGNDPDTVAKLFRIWLENYQGYFEEVIFATYDPSEEKKTFSAFQKVLGNLPV